MMKYFVDITNGWVQIFSIVHVDIYAFPWKVERSLFCKESTEVETHAAPCFSFRYALDRLTELYKDRHYLPNKKGFGFRRRK